MSDIQQSPPAENSTPPINVDLDNATDVTEADFFAQLEGLLSKLVPPDSVTIKTCSGKDVVLPGAIPARRQVPVFRLMKELLELEGVENALSSVTGGQLDGAGAIINIVIGLATDEQVAEKLGEIFDAAYPNAIEGDALDELPMEELVVALVPFSERFIKRVGGGLTTLVKPSQQN